MFSGKEKPKEEAAKPVSEAAKVEDKKSEEKKDDKNASQASKDKPKSDPKKEVAKPAASKKDDKPASPAQNAIQTGGVFGTTGKYHAQAFSDISSKDPRSDLNSVSSVNKSFMKPDLGVELKDRMLANTITIKFRNFKTLLKSESSVKVPERMFFTTKFFNFHESKTEMGLLRLPIDQAKTLEQQRNVQGGS